jgi:hypothetical protein
MFRLTFKAALSNSSFLQIILFGCKQASLFSLLQIMEKKSMIFFKDTFEGILFRANIK